MKDIFTIHSLAEALAYIGPNTLVLLDIDNTLIEAADPQAHIDYFDAQRDHLIAQGYPLDTVREELRPYWIEAQVKGPVRLMEPTAPAWVRSLQDAGVAVMGLTHRYWEARLVACTERQLGHFGFDLRRTAPEQVNGPSPYPHTGYAAGILYAGNQHKSTLLERFWPKGAPVTRVVFLDDKRENVLDLKAHVPTAYTGLHYRFIDTRPKVFDPELHILARPHPCA